MTSLDLGKKMVVAANNANLANQYIGHASLVDLTKLAPIVSALGDFGTDLVAQGGQYGAEIIDALGKSHNTELDGTYFIDLREFCKNVLQEPNLKNVNRIVNECNAIVSGLNDAVQMTMTANTTIPRGGMCIHFPWRADMFDSADYVKLQFQATNWYSFLSKLIAALGGGGGGTGDIHIVSTPAGAEIWLDGNDLGGVTPATVQDVPEGQHQVKLTLNGYQDWTGNVDVVAGQTAEVNATLQQGGGGQTDGVRHRELARSHAVELLHRFPRHFAHLHDLPCRYRPGESRQRRIYNPGKPERTTRRLRGGVR